MLFPVIVQDGHEKSLSGCKLDHKHGSPIQNISKLLRTEVLLHLRQKNLKLGNSETLGF